MSSRINFILLVILFLVGLSLRFYKLDEGLIFGYDQARDAYRATEIITKGDLKLLGPETDIPGVHHGVGYYYLISVPYALFKDPVATAGFLSLLNASGIFIVYWSAYKFFQKVRPALIASALYAFSFEIVQYSRWLSNPSLGLITVLIAFLGLWLWVKGNKSGFITALASIALSLHFQFFLAYLFLMPILVYFIYKPKLDKKTSFLGILPALIIGSPIIISEFKFNFQTLAAFGRFIGGQSQSYNSVSEFLLRYFDRFTSVIYHTIIPINPVIAFLLGLLVFLVLYKNKNLINRKSPLSLFILWLISAFPIFAFSSGAINSEFSFVGISISLIFLTAYILDILWNHKDTKIWAKIVLAVIITANIRFNLLHSQDGAYIFSVQSAMTYGLEKKLIDYTYHEAQGKPFSICTLTNPLFINTTWSYLYENYGKNKYGYLPYFAGSNQEDYLSYLPKDTVKPPLRFLVYEPLIGIPATSIELFRNLEEFVSDKEEEKNFGTFKVEKRKLLTSAAMGGKKSTFLVGYTEQFENDAYLPYRCFN